MALPEFERINVTKLDDLKSQLKSRLNDAWLTSQDNPAASEKYFILNLNGLETALKVDFEPGKLPQIWTKSLRHMSATIGSIKEAVSDFIKDASKGVMPNESFYHDVYFEGDNKLKLSGTQQEGGMEFRLPPENPLADALETLQSKTRAQQESVTDKTPQPTDQDDAVAQSNKPSLLGGWMNKFSHSRQQQKREPIIAEHRQTPRGPKGPASS